MFYICIPGNIISIPDVWNHGYIEILIDGIFMNIPIKSFAFIINNDKNYYMYKINSIINTGIYYKIKTTNDKSYLITKINSYITYDNYNTILLNNNIYDNGIATIYNDNSDLFIKIGEKVIEASI